MEEMDLTYVMLVTKLYEFKEFQSHPLGSYFLMMLGFQWFDCLYFKHVQKRFLWEKT